MPRPAKSGQRRPFNAGVSIYYAFLLVALEANVKKTANTAAITQKNIMVSIIMIDSYYSFPSNPFGE
jgi:hypothetical protein